MCSTIEINQHCNTKTFVFSSVDHILIFVLFFVTFNFIQYVGSL